MNGAVDLSECPYPVGRCKCGICVFCGFSKHMAIHAPVLGEMPGTKPWGHEFTTIEEIETAFPLCANCGHAKNAHWHRDCGGAYEYADCGGVNDDICNCKRYTSVPQGEK